MHPEFPMFDWFESLKTYGSKPGLHPVRGLLKLLKNPQLSYDSIHVTGTNGKGSSTAMIASILRESNYNVGVFTSPHLSKINESIKVNDQKITNSDMEKILAEIKEKCHLLQNNDVRHTTHFEVLVALAYTYFREKEVDIAVVEVGMGGRDDATNVIDSLASIVTNVSLEHTQWLGETIEKITENKASILNHNSILITATTQPPVIQKLQEVANKKNSSFLRVDNEYKIKPETQSLDKQQFSIQTPYRTLKHLSTPLLGEHQLRNAACAIAAVEAAQGKGYTITEENIHKGLASVYWPGRFEIMKKRPLIILDGAKDAAAIQALCSTIKQYLPCKHLITVLGISSDKAHSIMIESLSEITDHFILTEHRIESRTAKAVNLQVIAEKTGKTTEIATPIALAIEKAKKLARPESVILVTGSVFLIGEAREQLV